MSKIPREEDPRYETHPSYGMIQFARVTGGGKRKLFGSAIRDHNTTIRLRICQGEIKHDLGQDWYYADSLPFVEVELSPFQFAELLTTMNVSSGVPCTVLNRNGEDVPGKPDDEVEVDRIRSTYKADAARHSAEFSKYTSDLLSRLSEPGPIKATEKKEIADSIARIKQEIETNMPWYVDQFEEATQKITSTAKAEVDAFITHVVTAAGVKALHSSTVEEQRKLLGGGTTDKKFDPVE